MQNKIKYSILNYFIAIIWLINGFFCKVLNLVPRHQQIVARILGNEFAPFLTKIIGFAEIGMVIWILSKFHTRLNAITQIVIIATMNLIEFFYANDLLLWGKLNALFAILFMLLIYANEFIFNHKQIM
jgi:DoxX-like family